MLLYHGSMTGLYLPIVVDYSDNPCDFGQGFYLGDMKEQAENRVCNSAQNRIYQMDLALEGLRVYRFSDVVLWALFVGINRGRLDPAGYPLLQKITEDLLENYDVLVGHIADDKIAQSFNRFLDEDMTDLALAASLAEVRYGCQYVLKTQKAVDMLKITDVWQMDKEQRRLSLAWGQGQKKNLDERLDGIRRQYRRTGRFVDEILETYR